MIKWNKFCRPIYFIYKSVALPRVSRGGSVMCRWLWYSTVCAGLLCEATEREMRNDVEIVGYLYMFVFIFTYITGKNTFSLAKFDFFHQNSDTIIPTFFRVQFCPHNTFQAIKKQYLEPRSYPNTNASSLNHQYLDNAWTECHVILTPTF